MIPQFEEEALKLMKSGRVVDFDPGTNLYQGRPCLGILPTATAFCLLSLLFPRLLRILARVQIIPENNGG